MTTNGHISITFDAQRTATAIHVPPSYSPADALAALKLPPFDSTIVVHGGAGNMELSMIAEMRTFLVASLTPMLEHHRPLVVDGATHSGVGRVLGDVREQVGGFPLLGVMPHRFALYPGGPPLDEQRMALNPSHSHLIFVDGKEWGDESEMLIGILQATHKPGIALIINGGQIVLQEAKRHAELGNRLVIIDGSGRMADTLANPDSPERQSFPPDAEIYVVHINAPQAFTDLLTRLLAVPQGS